MLGELGFDELGGDLESKGNVRIPNHFGSPEEGVGDEDGLGFAVDRTDELSVGSEAKSDSGVTVGKFVGFAGCVVEEHPRRFKIGPGVWFGGSGASF